MPSCSSSRTHRLQNVWRKTEANRCAHCGHTAYRKTVDHFIPISIGGGNDSRNLMPLCYDCNFGRKSEIVDPWRFYQYAKPWAIKGCQIYLSEWKKKRTTMDGAFMEPPKTGWR